MKQFAPCIVAKAKVALKLPNRYKGNTKKCSDQYWEEVIKCLTREYNIIDKQRINKAINRTDLYKRK